MGKSKKQSVRSIAKQLAELEKAYSGSPTQVLYHDGVWVSDLGGAIVGEIPPALVLGKAQEEVDRMLILERVNMYDGSKPKTIWPPVFRGMN